MSDKLEGKDIDPKKIDWNELAGMWDDFDEAQDYTKIIYGLLTEKIDLQNLKIIDFGCGTGHLTDYMAPKAEKIIAIDTAEKMIEVLKNKNHQNVIAINADLSEKTLEDNPVLSEKFDLIVAASVCAFLPNYEMVLGVIKSLLKPDGMFVQWDWLQSPREPDFGFTKEMIRESYSKVGFKLDSVDIPFHMEENGEKMDVIMAVGRA